jgi:ATP-dependent DNA helicase 2 subunit 2
MGDMSAKSSNTIIGDVETADGTAANNASDSLAPVKNSRTYEVEDESAAGGKREVDREDLAKGYEYGRTAVHISESDENITKLETNPGLEIVGFVPKDKVSNISPHKQEQGSQSDSF